MREVLNEHELKFRDMEMRMVAVEKTVEKISDLFFGNGTPGVKENIRTLMAEVSNLADKLSLFVSESQAHRERIELRELESRIWWKRLVIGATVTTVISTGIPLLLSLWLLYTKLGQTP